MREKHRKYISKLIIPEFPFEMHLLFWLLELIATTVALQSVAEMHILEPEIWLNFLHPFLHFLFHFPAFPLRLCRNSQKTVPHAASWRSVCFPVGLHFDYSCLLDQNKHKTPEARAHSLPGICQSVFSPSQICLVLCIFVCVSVWVWLCAYSSRFICMFLCLSLCTHYLCVCVCMFIVYLCLCMCICGCICLCK